MRQVFIIPVFLVASGAYAASTFVYYGSDGVPVLTNRKPLSSSAREREKYLLIVNEAAAENLVDPELLNAIITVESSWNPSARSSKGALGLMQLMPKTAHNWGVTNAFDPHQNILAGARYFKHLIMLFDRNITLALAAYHAGEERIIRDGKVPNIPETQQYVKDVTQTYKALISRKP
jgi:soluble lytic murein transglycosylase-like protein